MYGDAALFAANGKQRNFTFLTGTLPELDFPVGGSIPVAAKNKQWNWVLFYYREFRRLFLRRFPYKVFYLMKGDRVIVFRILHVKQDYPPLVGRLG